jgi:acyl-CoA reductase-like NAD-dependent aldehyde dehydrogenase
VRHLVDRERAVADVPQRTGLLLDGVWEDRARTLPVTAPATGEVLSHQAVASPADVDRAVGSARAALRSPLPLAERAAILDRCADLVRRDHEHLARLIALEAAKPVRAARVEVERCEQTLRFSAAEARTLHDRTLPVDAHPGGAGATGFVRRDPIGVVAAITPFNFPLNLVAHKLGPALAAGCPVVLKPAERTPLSAVELAERLQEAGLPAGWLAVLTGDGPGTGATLAAHPHVDVLSFTGSVDVGWALAREAGHARVLLELGSAAPLVLEADGDVDTVVAAVAAHGFVHAGQSCVSVQRLLVHASVADRVLERLTAAVDDLVVGDPLDERTDVSCLIDEPAARRVQGWIDEAADAGARVVVGGTRDGAFVVPTVVDDVPLDAALWTREAFGPVVAVRRFTSTDEALAAVAAGPDLIHLGVFTRDLDLALRYVDEVRAGAVLVNESPTFRLDHVPYGGVGRAGTTREGPAAAVRELTVEKVVLLRPSVAR